MKKKLEVVIDRSKWRTGWYGVNQTQIGDIRLLNNKGAMCCLGFVCKTYIQSKKKGYKNCLENIAEPEQLNMLIPELNQKGQFGFSNSELTDDAISINDNEETTPEQKEKELLDLFKNTPYKLKFTGKYTYAS